MRRRRVDEAYADNHRRLIKLLNSLGYTPVRQKGLHLILEHRETKKITIVPIHSRDIGVGLLSMILKEVGISRERYFELLGKV